LSYVLPPLGPRTIVAIVDSGLRLPGGDGRVARRELLSLLATD
jgi:hypothetical protein